MKTVDLADFTRAVRHAAGETRHRHSVRTEVIFEDEDGIEIGIAEWNHNEHGDDPAPEHVTYLLSENWPRRFKTLGGFTRDHGDPDGYGGSKTTYSVVSVRHDQTDEEIGEWVRNNYPETRCEHEYDCCGNYYASSATWSFFSRAASAEDRGEIVIRQGWGQNV